MRDYTSRQNLQSSSRIKLRQYLFAPIFFIIFSITFTSVGSFIFYKEYYLRNFGAEVTGDVLGKNKRTSRSNGKTKTSYHIRYEYTANNNMTYSDKNQVSYDFYKSTNKQDRVQVIYQPNAPFTSALKDGGSLLSSFVSCIFSVVGFVIFLFSLKHFFSCINKYREDKLLAQNGRAQPAKIISKKDVKSKGKIRYVIIKYSWLDSLGIERKDGENVAPDIAERYNEGDQISILITPEKPNISYWPAE